MGNFIPRKCEENNDHTDYCEHCSTCHECLEEGRNRDEAKILSLQESMEPKSIQEFFTFEAIKEMTTKEVSDVFTNLYESRKATAELNVDLGRKLNLIASAVADNDSEFDAKTINRIKAALNGNS